MQGLTRQAQDSREQSPESQEEPSLATLPGAIEGLRVTLEGQIAGVLVEVSLLRAGLSKVVDKVSKAKISIETLQSKVRQLKQQMTLITTITSALEERAEDGGEQSRRNNIRLLGIPEGKSVEQFLEQWL
ncbi:hypothetical protein NDU88_001551 [Pleurodeles waltl]|uniref:Uncharacterized protein n=1 Tax=Pleurodeles waltl TaxID=8319 RepID=A0AAV7SAD7_PLEWA|nr:hypothetical protein NDU88_001551 [Pleurodeles waltl]